MAFGVQSQHLASALPWYHHTELLLLCVFQPLVSLCHGLLSLLSLPKSYRSFTTWSSVRCSFFLESSWPPRPKPHLRGKDVPPWPSPSCSDPPPTPHPRRAPRILITRQHSCLSHFLTVIQIQTQMRRDDLGDLNFKKQSVLRRVQKTW